MGFCIGTAADGSAYITGDGTACAVGEVAVYSQAEVDSAAIRSFPDIFNISLEGGAQISAAIVAVWAVAFCFRLLARQLFESEVGVPEKDES